MEPTITIRRLSFRLTLLFLLLVGVSSLPSCSGGSSDKGATDVVPEFWGDGQVLLKEDIASMLHEVISVKMQFYVSARETMNSSIEHPIHIGYFQHYPAPKATQISSDCEETARFKFFDKDDVVLFEMGANHKGDCKHIVLEKQGKKYYHEISPAGVDFIDDKIEWPNRFREKYEGKTDSGLHIKDEQP